MVGTIVDMIDTWAFEVVCMVSVAEGISWAYGHRGMHVCMFFRSSVLLFVRIFDERATHLRLTM
jgi:hypothetical protein